MYGWDDLKKIRVDSSNSIECPILSCKNSVPRMIKKGLNLNSSKAKLQNYFCQDHKIYISPSTWEYLEKKVNLLWYQTSDQELLENILKNGVKRESRMERDNSEDALTWNFFRYLEDRIIILDKLFTHVLDRNVSNSKLIYWSYCQIAKDVYPLLKKARAIFGEQAHQSSEPDLICETDEALIFIEAKLTAHNNTSGSGKNLERHLENSKEYLTGDNCWFEKVFQTDYCTIVNCQKYELMRFWLLGTWMAKEIKKDFYLINLVPMYSEHNIKKQFQPLIKENHSNKFLRLTWEEIYNFCKA